MAHYVHDDNNNRILALSKEEVYALLALAIQQGQLPSVDQDTAFVTMIKSIVDGNAYKIGFCTQAQYNQLEAQGLLEGDALYFITDDDTLEDIDTILTNINSDLTSLQTALTNLQETKENLIEFIEIICDANGQLTSDFDFNKLIQNLDKKYYAKFIDNYNVDPNSQKIYLLTNIEIVFRPNSTSQEIYFRNEQLQIFVGLRLNDGTYEVDDISLEPSLNERVEDLESDVATLKAKHLYRHDINWGAYNDSYLVSFTLYTSDSEELTNLTLKDYLTLEKPISAGGVVTVNNNKYIVTQLKMSDTLAGYYSYGAVYIDNNTISELGLGYSNTASSHTFSDTVTLVY